MNEERKDVRTIIIIALITSVLGISVAFAALNQTLYINANGTFNGSEWKIRFTDATGNVNPGSDINASYGDIYGIGTTIISVNNIVFVTPGDSVSYVITTTNQGSINAKMGGMPILMGLLNTTADYANAILSYDITDPIKPGGDIQIGDVIDASASRVYKLIVTYNPLAANPPKDDVEISLSVTFPLIQNRK